MELKLEKAGPASSILCCKISLVGVLVILYRFTNKRLSTSIETIGLPSLAGLF